jgi:MFS family permease
MPTLLRRFLDRAKTAASSVALGLAMRGAAGVLFALSGCFVIAAIAGMLVDRFGAAKAYWLMTAGLVIVGLIAAVVVAIKEECDERQEQEASAKLVETAAAEAVTQMPIALAAAALSTQAGASTALSLARVLGRHWPLVILVGGIGALVWPSDGQFNTRGYAGDKRWG